MGEGPTGVIQGLDVVGAVIPKRVAYQAERTRIRIVVIQAVCIDDLQKSRASNEYWLEQLSGAYEEPRRFDAIRGVIQSLESVDAAQIRQAAQTYLLPGALFRLQITPAAGATAAP